MAYLLNFYKDFPILLGLFSSYDARNWYVKTGAAPGRSEDGCQAQNNIMVQPIFPQKSWLLQMQ